MKKFFLMAVLCLCGCIATMAQTTRIVTGAVIDKDGNPIPGAMVGVPNGAEEAIVDADGTFSIEVPVWSKKLVARYAGMQDKKLKIKNGEEMVFRMKTEIPNQWFLNLVGQVGEDLYAGLMAGYLGNWGGYLKVTSILTSRNYSLYPAVTAGATKRICRWLHAYLGVGTGPNYYDEYWFAMDLGLMIKPTKHFNINLGLGVVDFPGFQFGLGYSF